MKNIAVFVSGTGSLLEAMIADKLPITLVLADRQCHGFEIADRADIPVVFIRREFTPDFDRVAYTNLILQNLVLYNIQFVAMAGFMTVLDKSIFAEFGGRILNTHPALLPSFKGDHAVRDALAFGVKVTGCTIHVATEKLDDGKIIAQEAVSVMFDDTEATLHERIKVVERRLYPATIRQFAETI